MKRRAIPQFDLPAMAEVFNLRQETATDGERIAREREERELAKIRNEARQGQFRQAITPAE